MMLLRKLALVATFLATAAVASPNPLAAPPGVPLPPGVSVPGGAGGDPNAWIQALPLRAENGTNIRHACQHIHKALHKRQFFGPFHAASDGAYFNSTYKYYDARQAGNRVSVLMLISPLDPRTHTLAFHSPAASFSPRWPRT